MTELTKAPVNRSATLPGLRIDASFVEALDGDAVAGSQTVDNMHWSHVKPRQASNPKLVAWSSEMTDLLGLPVADHPQQTAQIFTGSTQPENAVPYAMRYGGHQFGNWAGQLGDGRAIALGETTDRQGQHWTLQLKGAGATPYSRQGDGLAVLRSSIREYLCAEAMHHLGIPTTRSLTLCTTGQQVDRDIFYNGNVQAEPGAILCRAAQSFVRFGSFEIHAAQRENQQLKALADHVITRDFPELGAPSADTYQQWFEIVLQRTAKLICDWQRVGFVHAVMNTDNMSILGQTIDYGPYGWMEEYNPDWTPNFIDRERRRYRYGNQPQVGLWNLYRLANAIAPLFDGETKPLEEVLGTYNEHFDTHWHNTVAHKLGIASPQRDDKTLFNELWEILQLTPTDFTVFFRRLAHIDAAESPQAEELLQAVSAAFYEADDINGENSARIKHWLQQWQQRVAASDTAERRSLMNRTNPAVVLRNYLAQLVIDDAEQGDYSRLEELHTVLRTPYDEHPDFPQYTDRRPDWATGRPGCTMLTCSS